MSYLFFDIEAANRHESVAKIYSFGYVLTDNKFNVIEKDEIIINPEAEYYFTINGVHVKIDCPIDSEDMGKVVLFPKYHSRIKKLLSDSVCIGYGTSIDAHMLHESCKRYELDSFKFKFYDLVEISDELLDEKVAGLTKLASKLDIVNENPHNGLSDAITTYEICKKLLHEKKSDITTLGYRGKIYMYEAKDYKVFKFTKNGNRFVPKRRFKDMKIIDTNKTDDEILSEVDNVNHNNSMREEMMKWVKEAGLQETHTHNNN